MEMTNLQDSLDIRRTQISKIVTPEKKPGWFDDTWHIVMLVLGLLTMLVFVLLIFWQSGGINGLAQLWQLKTNSELTSAPTPVEKLIYRNSSLGAGFEYTQDYSIDQPEQFEVKVSTKGPNEGERVSVVLLGLPAASASGELQFDCGRYIDGCRKIEESVEDYTRNDGLNGFINDMEITTSSGSGKLRAFTFDIEHIKFAKLMVLPVGENSNWFAQELAQKVFLIEPTNQ